MKSTWPLFAFLLVLGTSSAYAAGEWKPVLNGYHNRTPEQLRDEVRGGRANISEEVLLERLRANGHAISSLDELAGSRSTIVPCPDIAAQKTPDALEFESVSSDGTFPIIERGCYTPRTKGEVENLLLFDERLALSLMCGNPAVGPPPELATPQEPPREKTSILVRHCSPYNGGEQTLSFRRWWIFWSEDGYSVDRSIPYSQGGTNCR